jgi:hypothetical protein
LNYRSFDASFLFSIDIEYGSLGRRERRRVAWGTCLGYLASMMQHTGVVGGNYAGVLYWHERLAL